jgi:hypothetical protein
VGLAISIHLLFGSLFLDHMKQITNFPEQGKKKVKTLHSSDCLLSHDHQATTEGF